MSGPEPARAAASAAFCRSLWMSTIQPKSIANAIMAISGAIRMAVGGAIAPRRGRAALRRGVISLRLSVRGPGGLVDVVALTRHDQRFGLDGRAPEEVRGGPGDLGEG